MSKVFSLQVVITAAVLSGCTAVNVKPVSADNQVDHICIQQNPRVTVRDFVPVMQEGFGNHGITSEVITSSSKAGCLYTATYTARRSWDISTYLSEAQIAVLKDGRQIAQANYHLRGKGGFALNKWASTRSKILPVIDQLLAQVPRPGTGGATLMTASNTTHQVSGELATKLAHLKDAYDAQLITPEEYEAKRKAIVDAY